MNETMEAQSPEKEKQSFNDIFEKVSKKYKHRDYDIYYYNPDTKEIIKGVNVLPHEPEHQELSQLIYIGDEKTYKKFHEELGVDEFHCHTYSRSRVACFGTNTKTGEWFGWSHRGYGKFYPGFEVTEGSMLAKKFAAGYSPKTDEHCELMAEVFADLMD